MPETKPTRSTFGRLALWAFVAFNVVLPALLLHLNLQPVNTGEDTMAQAYGTFVLLPIWAVGAIVLGVVALLTRPERP